MNHSLTGDIGPGTDKPERFNLPRAAIVLFAIVMACWQINQRHAAYLADDGGFFLKYVENLANGHGWRFNSADPNPIWGASAPFWPLIVAFPVFLGMSAPHAIVLCGVLLTLLSVVITTITLDRKFGHFASLAFAAVALSNQWLAYFATAGLETPLSLFLISIGLFLICEDRRRPLIEGFVGFLILNNKIDFIPIGLAYVFAIGWKSNRQELKQMLITTIALTASWLLFAFLHFGSIIPNSFLTKLRMANQGKPVEWRWFINETLWTQGMRFLLPFSVAGILLNFKRNGPVLLFLASILIHIVAFTLKPPSEPFAWYLPPTTLSLVVLAAIGIQSIAQMVSKSWILLVPAILIFGLATQKYHRFERKLNPAPYADLVERDRTEAAIWVDKTLGQNYSVEAWFGNVAYWSNRYAYDYNYLNRDLDRDLKSNFRAHYSTDVRVSCPAYELKSTTFAQHIQEELARDQNNGYKPVHLENSSILGGVGFYCVVYVKSTRPEASQPDQSITPFL